MKSIKIGLSALYNKYILKKAEFWILCMRYIYIKYCVVQIIQKPYRSRPKYENEET